MEKQETPDDVIQAFGNALPVVTIAPFRKKETYRDLFERVHAGEILHMPVDGIGKFYLAPENYAQYIRDPHKIKNTLSRREISESNVGIAMNTMYDAGGFFILYGNSKDYIYLLMQSDVKRALGKRYPVPHYIQEINSIKGLDKMARAGLIHVFSSAVLDHKTPLINKNPDGTLHSLTLD